MLHAVLLLGLLAGGAAAGQPLSGTGVAIPRHTGRAAGGRLTGAGLVLQHTLGEVGGSYSGAGRGLAAGFIPLSSWPGALTALSAVSKSSGELTLAWTAPGRDGFSGGLSSGLYRLDWSSDAAHAFAPTTYRLEFATAVVPGQASALTLTGLDPNTTYYARVYLGDEGRVFAEDSRRADESTMAGVVTPVVAAVADTSVVLSWTLPAGGAEGFTGAASTASAGGALAGALTAAATGGLQVSLTIAGLTPNTSYFFRVASLNWQGQPAYTTVIATLTRASGAPLPVSLLGLSPDALGRTVVLNWSNPVLADPRGVLVLVSTNPAAAVADGSAPAVGQTLPDGSVVRSTALVGALLDGGLTLDATRFYHLFGFNGALAYSVRVTTAVFLDLPPAGVAGLSAALSPGATSLALAWAPVTSNSDGSLFASTGTPRAVELAGYEVMRATALADPVWSAVSTVAASAMGFAAAAPPPGAAAYYRVDAVDSLGARGAGLPVDAVTGDLFAVAADSATSFRVPAALSRELLASGNRYGVDLALRVKTEPASAADHVLNSVRFEALALPRLEPVPDFRFSGPAAVTLGYGGAGAQAFHAASAADGNVGLYWFDGAKYVKLFGRVDRQARTVTAQTPLVGVYQVRDLARSTGFAFDISSLSNKAITPNGDGLNDAAVFLFDNPRDSAFSGTVYDLQGAYVAGMTPGPVKDSLQWDAKAGGRVVDGGVYVYQIRGEDKVFNGTLVVVR